ncbi:MAG TPA: polysaccharide export protein [Gammaproteobacteria bacterium]|nr:polysaccharide export protein [Gammaproteobacteria bacterium]
MLLTFTLLLLSTAVNAQTEYTFGAGDKVKIQVLGEPDMTIETLVSDSGMISYPFLGTIKVQGMTAAELEQFVTDKLKGPYLINPIVTVSLLQYRNFYVNGWVKNPGGYPFQPGMTVRKAITLAGGFSERADRKNIVVIPGKTPDVAPSQITLSDLVAPGDVITVKRSFF